MKSTSSQKARSCVDGAPAVAMRTSSAVAVGAIDTLVMSRDASPPASPAGSENAGMPLQSAPEPSITTPAASFRTESISA
jgi:hypothetical protein